MTNGTDVQVVTSPQIQVVLGQDAAAEEHVIPYADLAQYLEDEAQEPGMISDPDLIAAVARYLDRDVGDFGNCEVTRPETGNINIGPKPVFGIIDE